MSPCFSGRGGGTRTPDLSVPNAARYQLRYTPGAHIATDSIGLSQARWRGSIGHHLFPQEFANMSAAAG